MVVCEPSGIMPASALLVRFRSDASGEEPSTSLVQEETAREPTAAAAHVSAVRRERDGGVCIRLMGLSPVWELCLSV